MTDLDTSTAPARISANQVVAYNMAAYRRAAGMTQADLAVQLQSRTTLIWTKVSVSAAERSWENRRPKHFDAVQLCALCDIFKVPIIALFLPPDEGGPWLIAPISEVTTGREPAEGADPLRSSWWRTIAGVTDSHGKGWGEFQRRLRLSEPSSDPDSAPADFAIGGENPVWIDAKTTLPRNTKAAIVDQVVAYLTAAQALVERLVHDEKGSEPENDQ